MTQRGGPGPGGAAGRWLTPTSAQLLGLLSPAELARLRSSGTVRRVEPGTLVAASGTFPTKVQVVAEGELELMARLGTGRTTMAVVRSGGVIPDIALGALKRAVGCHEDRS